MKKSTYPELSEQIVIGIFENDDASLAALVNHYENYIRKLCTMRVTDSDGGYQYSFLDEDLMQNMRIGIIRAVEQFMAKFSSDLVLSESEQPFQL